MRLSAIVRLLSAVARVKSSWVRPRPAEPAVGARVDLLDLARVAHGQVTTRDAFSTRIGRRVSRSPAHGPPVQNPVSGSKIAPWVEQTSARPSSVKNSLGQRSSGVPTCGHRSTYA